MANVATGCKSKKRGVDGSNAFSSYPPDWTVKLHQTPSHKDDPCPFQIRNKSHKPRAWNGGRREAREQQECEDIEPQEREARERQERARRIVIAAMKEKPLDISSWSGPNHTQKDDDIELRHMRMNAARRVAYYKSRN